jgi:hypothetical protein
MADSSILSVSRQSTRFSIRAACLGAIALLVLSGCTRLQVRLGSKVHLDAVPIKSMAAMLSKGPGIVPGQKASLVAVITDANGKVLQTEGAGQGKVLWSDLKVTASVVTAKKKGVVSLARDPRVSDGKVPHVTITVPGHPDIRAELNIPVRYDYPFTANFSGSSGPSGFNGADGLNGTSGASGSLDLNNPSPGGNGSNGSDGSNGQDGGSGGDAPPVQIRVALRSGSHPLLQVDVLATGREEVFLVDPRGGSLTVAADGGSGGSGGRGGRGGRGGSGGIGTPSGSNGRDGTDGRKGWDGSSGRGGSITVTYDPAVAPYLGAIHLSNRGGPAPVFNEEPVAPLW